MVISKKGGFPTTKVLEDVDKFEYKHDKMKQNIKNFIFANVHSIKGLRDIPSRRLLKVIVV